MDKEALVAEICKRVQAKMTAMGLQDGAASSAAVEDKSGLPGLLILTADHGDRCHAAYECPNLNAQYRVECALMKEYNVDVADYNVVIAYNLTNEALGKLAQGIFDDDYTRLFGKAILTGKKIYVPKEEVELYQYKEKSPAVYYQKLEENLKLLVNSGVVIVPDEELPKHLLTGAVCKEAGASKEAEPCKEEKKECAAAEKTACSSEREVTIAKKVISESDIKKLRNIDRVTIDNKALLTDLAKELAVKSKITILRDDLSGKGRNNH